MFYSVETLSPRQMALPSGTLLSDWAKARRRASASNTSVLDSYPPGGPGGDPSYVSGIPACRSPRSIVCW